MDFEQKSLMFDRIVVINLLRILRKYRVILAEGLHYLRKINKLTITQLAKIIGEKDY